MTYLSPKNIYNRLLSESPTFFNKMRKVMLSLGVGGGALIAAKNMYKVELDFISVHVGGYLVTAGVIGAFLTSLTTKDPQDNIK